MIFENKDKVLGSECDTNANLSVIGAFNKIQDNVCIFFASLNIHQIELKTKYNFIWVYTKNTITFNVPLAWNEEFTVKCFISQITPAKMIVDTAFINKKDEIALYSKIEVALLDVGSQRLKRIYELGLDETICEKSLIDFEVEKLNNEDGYIKIGDLIVKSTNIDYCLHTNNVEYVRFILDTYKVEDLIRKPIKKFSINYLKQSVEGEKMSICKKAIDDRDKFIIKKYDDNVIKVDITF